MKVLVADDESSARSRLIRLLGKEADLEIIGQAANGLEAVDLIENLQPDLVFLDIEMPGLNGLDALRAVRTGHPLPLVIFVTGYDEHALRAFNAQALAYLLKPVDPTTFSQAVERARRLHAYQKNESSPAESAGRGPVDLIAQELKAPLRHIVGRRQGRSLLVPVDSIRYFALDQGILKAHVENEAYWVNFHLNELEARLSDGFFRARREVLINLNHIREFRPYFKSGILLLMNDALGSEIVVSERQVPLLRRRVPGL